MIQKFEDKLNEDVWAQSNYYSEQEQDLFTVSNENFNFFLQTSRLHQDFIK